MASCSSNPGTGRLTEEQFKQGIELLVEFSEKFGAGWTLERVERNGRSHCFMKTSFVEEVTLSSIEEDKLDDDDELSHMLCDVTIDDSISTNVVTSGNRMMCKFDCHVVHSTSYEVPVLYFNVYKLSGSLLSLDEIWQLVPAEYKQRLLTERWTFVTQDQHPVLGCPFYQLHPCHTAKLMSKTFHHQTPSTESSQNIKLAACRYIVSWLSAVGPVAFVKLSVDFAQI